MHLHSTANWRHGQTFGQDRPREGERRTLLVLALTAATMAVEIAAGLAFGSVALLADGLRSPRRAGGSRCPAAALAVLGAAPGLPWTRGRRAAAEG